MMKRRQFLPLPLLGLFAWAWPPSQPSAPQGRQDLIAARAWCAPDAPLLGQLERGEQLRGVKTMQDTYGQTWQGIPWGEGLAWVLASEIEDKTQAEKVMREA